MPKHNFSHIYKNVKDWEFARERRLLWQCLWKYSNVKCYDREIISIFHAASSFAHKLQYKPSTVIPSQSANSNDGKYIFGYWSPRPYRPSENSKKNEWKFLLPFLWKFLYVFSLPIHSRIRQITVILKVRRRVQGQNEYLWLTSHYIGESETFFMCNFKICYQNFPLTFCCFICQTESEGDAATLRAISNKKSASIRNWISFLSSELRNSFSWKIHCIVIYYWVPVILRIVNVSVQHLKIAFVREHGRDFSRSLYSY